LRLVSLILAGWRLFDLQHAGLIMSKPWFAGGVTVAALFALACVVAGARAADIGPVDVKCMPLTDIPHHEEFVKLSHDQWQAARVLFFSAPNTPTTLPPGDHALIHKGPSGQGALVFVDGDEACAPVILPHEAVDLLDQIEAGVITHALGRM
jgi:hypothetical protein